MALLEVTNVKKIYSTRFGGNKALRKTRQAALFLLRPAGYLVSSANAAFALSTAGPAVTFRKASMACGFISLAL